MRKAIQLEVRLWIEGEDEPAHDFAQSTIQAVKEMLAAGESSHPELKVTIKKIVEDTNYDAEDDETTNQQVTAPAQPQSSATPTTPVSSQPASPISPQPAAKPPAQQPTSPPQPIGHPESNHNWFYRTRKVKLASTKPKQGS